MQRSHFTGGGRGGSPRGTGGVACDSGGRSCFLSREIPAVNRRRPHATDWRLLTCFYISIPLEICNRYSRRHGEPIATCWTWPGGPEGMSRRAASRGQWAEGRHLRRGGSDASETKTHLGEFARRVRRVSIRGGVTREGEVPAASHALRPRARDEREVFRPLARVARLVEGSVGARAARTSTGRYSTPRRFRVRSTKPIGTASAQPTANGANACPRRICSQPPAWQLTCTARTPSAIVVRSQYSS